MTEPLTLHAADIMAMISYRAKQIVAAIDATAAGAMMPKPGVLSETLTEMQELTDRLRPLLKADA